MSLNRSIIENDAKRIAPPAAHAAKRLSEAASSLHGELDQLLADIANVTTVTPHDRIEILRLVENYKKKVFNLYSEAIATFNAISQGR